MVEGKIGPHERLEGSAGRRRRRALQGDIFQRLLAAGLAFGAELFRGIFDCLEDGRIGCRLGVFRGVKPLSKRPGARFEPAGGCQPLTAGGMRVRSS